MVIFHSYVELPESMHMFMRFMSRRSWLEHIIYTIFFEFWPLPMPVICRKKNSTVQSRPDPTRHTEKDRDHVIFAVQDDCQVLFWMVVARVFTLFTSFTVNEVLSSDHGNIRQHKKSAESAPAVWSWFAWLVRLVVPHPPDPSSCVCWFINPPIYEIYLGYRDIWTCPV